jgi:hypothetical protein
VHEENTRVDTLMSSRLGSVIDWTDSEAITRHFLNQQRLEAAAGMGGTHGMRLSQYFGDMRVERLSEEGKPDDRIKCKQGMVLGVFRAI